MDSRIYTEIKWKVRPCRYLVHRFLLSGFHTALWRKKNMLMWKAWINIIIIVIIIITTTTTYLVFKVGEAMVTHILIPLDVFFSL